MYPLLCTPSLSLQTIAGEATSSIEKRFHVGRDGVDFARAQSASPRRADGRLSSGSILAADVRRQLRSAACRRESRVSQVGNRHGKVRRVDAGAVTLATVAESAVAFEGQAPRLLLSGQQRLVVPGLGGCHVLRCRLRWRCLSSARHYQPEHEGPRQRHRNRRSEDASTSESHTFTAGPRCPLAERGGRR